MMPFKMDGIRLYKINKMINLEDLEEFVPLNNHSLQRYLLAINKRLAILNRPIFRKLIARLRYSMCRAKLSTYLSQFDVVIGVGFDYSLLLSELAIQLECKKIGWQHSTFDSYFERRGKLGYGLLDYSKSCFKRLDRVLVLTEADKKEFDKKLDINTDVFYNPIPRNQPKLSRLNKKNALFVGRLDRYLKGLDYLIEIIERVAALDLEVYFTIVGDGPDRKWLQDKIEKSKISKRVNIVGKTNNVYQYYSEASVLLQTSRFEGFGMTIVEAMSCGVPVVSFHNNGPDEIIRDGVDGYLVDKFDVDTFIRHVFEILISRDLRIDISRNCQERARDFSVEKLMNKFQQFLTM